MTPIRTCLLFLLALYLWPVHAFAEWTERKVDIHSEGVRIAGTVLQPQTIGETRLPALVMSHGWGGTAGMLRTQAERFVEAGYVVLLIDYRGWGESDARMVQEPGGARRELR